MRAHRKQLITLISIVAIGLVSSPAGANPDRRHRSDSPSAVARALETPSKIHHIDAVSAAVGRAHPAVLDNFRILSHVRMPGHQAAADIYFFDHERRGQFAYVGSFREPCTTDGVRIFDVTQPRRPRLADIAHLPRTYRTSVEDISVERVGDRTILAGGLQACGRHGKDGLALWDVTRPWNPALLSFLPTPGGVHELDLAPRADGSVLALLTNPFVEFADTYFGANRGGELRIVDITRPRHPARIANWGIIRDTDLPTFGGDPIISSYQGMDSFFAGIYAHSVRDADRGMTAYVSYWDAGILKLDISDPESPTFVGRTFYEIGDAGDGHSMFPLDANGTRYIIQNDEDYFSDSPISVTSSETGTTEFSGMHEPWMPMTLWDTGAITADVWDAGDGCDEADYSGADGAVVIVDTLDPFYEGVIDGWSVPCTFQRQIALAATSGATALLSNLVGPDDPYPFPYARPRAITPDEDMVVAQVADTDGLADALRSASGTTTVTLAPTTPAVGYVRIFDESQVTDLDGDGIAQEFTEVATFTEPDHVYGELSPPVHATWSVHNTEVSGDIAYSSWYSNGVVAWNLSDITSPTQVGQFRPRMRQGWPLTWGVAFDPSSGLVYSSDMRGGLWVTKPTGPAAGG